MKTFITRNDFISTLPDNLLMCEIGVFRGEFSEILFKTKPKELHLIDIFTGNMCSGDKDGKNIECIDLEESYNSLKEKYIKNNNIFIHKGTSKKILSLFDNNYFDFIYIDADHNYESVREDLSLSLLKIKYGGIISGHDYNKDKFPGVIQAVSEFCKNNNLTIDYITKDICSTYGINIK